MIAQMKDRGGRIKIPGFYDDVRPLSEVERAAWRQLPFNEKKYRKDLGAPKLAGEYGAHPPKGFVAVPRVRCRTRRARPRASA